VSYLASTTTNPRANSWQKGKRRRGEALQLIKKQSPARLTITEKQHSPPQTEWQLLERFATAAYQSYSLGCPRIDHLLVLTKANVYRAFLDNITLLGLVADGICSANILSPFNLHGPVRDTQTTVIIPPSLRPTSYQRSVPHHHGLIFSRIPKFAITSCPGKVASVNMSSAWISWASGTQMRWTICY
jgi:hypothetical protein